MAPPALEKPAFPLPQALSHFLFFDICFLWCFHYTEITLFLSGRQGTKQNVPLIFVENATKVVSSSRRVCPFPQGVNNHKCWVDGGEGGTVSHSAQLGVRASVGLCSMPVIFGCFLYRLAQEVLSPV